MLEGKSFAVLVEDQYEDLELWYPVLRLREEYAEVRLVGMTAGRTYTSKHGYPAEADKSVLQVSIEDYDGLIIPGGYAPDRMRRHASMVELVRNAVEMNKIVGVICHGGWMLCSAGVLGGRRTTSFIAIKDDMVNAGAEWVDEEVVQDGNLITSRTPNDLPVFMRTIIATCADGARAAEASERAHHAG
jgi:protease I